MELGEITLICRSPAADIDAADLCDFLYLFRAVYAVSTKVIREKDALALLESPDDVRSSIRGYLRRASVKDINNLFTSNLGDKKLVAKQVTKGSPLTIVLAGSLVALVAAVIFSGGRIKTTLFEVELPPLGKGIKSLRDALAESTQAPIGYTVGTRRVKLNRKELRELMAHDPTTRDRGGFQRFLVGLQGRTNRHTGELVLADADMERILKYGRHPRRGGWQLSLRKIFGRHFDFGGAV